MTDVSLTPTAADIIIEFVDIVEQSIDNYKKMTTSIERDVRTPDAPWKVRGTYDRPEVLILKMNEIRPKMTELKPEGIALIDEWKKEYLWRFHDTETFCTSLIPKSVKYEVRKECIEELNSALYEFTAEADYLISQMRFDMRNHINDE